MSHVAVIEMEDIHDLDALAKAAADVGCELIRGQKTFKWYGRSVGDYPLPEGRNAGEMGHCDHAIKVKGSNSRTYEVGVVKSKTGSGYSLMWDHYCGGYGLEDAVGKGAVKLKRNYMARAAEAKLKKQGYKVRRQIDQDGQRIRLMAS